MVEFVSFSSGSCGNCYYLGIEGTPANAPAGIVIDAGVSVRRLKKNLMSLGLGFDNVGAVLVTHDHLDHIRHLGSFCKHISKPVYATSVMHDALAVHSFTRDEVPSCRRVLPEGEWNEVPCGTEGQTALVRYFIVPHDATQTVGFAIRIGGENFVLMTDIGRMTPEALSFARGADTVVIEANYDTAMLLGGPYPPDLKKRIYGGSGHLSNEACADAVRSFHHPGLKNIFLCHLSEHNNTPEAAFSAVAEALDDLGARAQTRLFTLPRTTMSPLFKL